MNLKCRLILEEYKRQKADFLKLGDVVKGILTGIIDDLGLTVLAVEHRVKEEKSLAGKLEKKGDGYNSLEDVTDILGCRVICFLSDEIDKIGKKVEESFIVDWENSSDKRALIKENAFGYLSLHYICSLPFGDKWPDEICGKKFEIQIRTILQHAWSAIEHDIGYKSDFGVPREINRQFARLAGLLELADDEFVRARNKMYEYTEDIRRRIKTGDVADVAINTLSLKEYVLHNEKMQKLIREISGIAGAEIKEIDPEGYVPQLAYLSVKNLGDIERLIDENYATAITLVKKAFSATNMDILSSSVALRFLCRAELINKNYDYDQIVNFLTISLGSSEKAERQAKLLLKQKEQLSVERDKVERALKFAAKKHSGQKRIGGEEYITHPIAVCEILKAQGYGEDYQIAALFHDLLEDTDATEEEILRYGNQEILTAVKLLTKSKGYNMAEYVGGIKDNEIAFAVKGADRLHNLRCALVADEGFKRKYALETLDWYLDFSPEIKKALKALADSLDNPIPELSFLYQPVDGLNV